MRLLLLFYFSPQNSKNTQKIHQKLKSLKLRNVEMARLRRSQTVCGDTMSRLSGSEKNRLVTTRHFDQYALIVFWRITIFFKHGVAPQTVFTYIILFTMPSYKSYLRLVMKYRMPVSKRFSLPIKHVQ